jgi:sec-independent protein translocase protein TatA
MLTLGAESIVNRVLLTSDSNADINPHYQPTIIHNSFICRKYFRPKVITQLLQKVDVMSLSIWQILLVVVLFILLFGRGRIPALMGDLAEGIRSFKKGIADEQIQPVTNAAAEKVQSVPLSEAVTAEAKAEVKADARFEVQTDPLHQRQA